MGKDRFSPHSCGWLRRGGEQQNTRLSARGGKGTKFEVSSNVNKEGARGVSESRSVGVEGGRGMWGEGGRGGEGK